MIAGVSFAVGLVVAGLVFLLLVLAFLRILPRPGSRSEPGTNPQVPFKSQTNDAIVIVQVGGRVEYMNSLARERFGLAEEESSDLERLARRVRPSPRSRWESPARRQWRLR